MSEVLHEANLEVGELSGGELINDEFNGLHVWTAYLWTPFNKHLSLD